MSERPALLVLTGPPGAGKTTLARRLAETSITSAVHLHTDDFFDAIKSGFVAPWLPEAMAQNETVTRAILAACGAYARDGYRVVIDGIVVAFRVPAYQAEAARLGLALDYVVLRPTRATAVARVRDRVVAPLPDYPAGVYDTFADMGPLEGHVIDSETAAPDALAAAVAEGLAAGRFRLS